MWGLIEFSLVSIYAVQRTTYFHLFKNLIALQSSLPTVFQSRLYRSIVMDLRQALGSTRSDLSFVFRKSAGKTTTGCCRVAISSRLQLGHRMRHQRRRKVHLPRLNRFYAVGVEQPFGEQRPMLALFRNCERLEVKGLLPRIQMSTEMRQEYKYTPIFSCYAF